MNGIREWRESATQMGRESEERWIKSSTTTWESVRNCNTWDCNANGMWKWVNTNNTNNNNKKSDRHEWRREIETDEIATEMGWECVERGIKTPTNTWESARIVEWDVKLS